MISKEKDPSVVRQISQLRLEKANYYKNSKCIKVIAKYIEKNNISLLMETTNDEFFDGLKQSIPSKYKATLDDYISTCEKISAIDEKLETLITPVELIAKTEENKKLIKQFNELMLQIKELAPNCTLSNIPSMFFNDTKDVEIKKSILQGILVKWIKRLNIKI
jgi:hypothetical protein